MNEIVQQLYLSTAVFLMVAAYREKKNRTIWYMVMAMMVLQVVA